MNFLKVFIVAIFILAVFRIATENTDVDTNVKELYEKLNE